MTERTNDVDQAERIRRLQERRAASPKSSAVKTRNTVTATTPTTGASPARARARRRHPAKGTRILLAGLSVASFFGIGGSLLLANSNAATVVQTATPSAPAAAGASSATPAATSTASHAPVVAHTTTRGS